jgi:hypothetical protein
MDWSATLETVAGEAPLVRWLRVLHAVGATRLSCADPKWSQRELRGVQVRRLRAGPRPRFRTR